MTAFHKSALLSLLLPYSPSSAGTASETIRFLNTDPITITASTEQEPKICREDVIIGSASCLGNNATMCQEKCALYGTTSLLEKCCMYSGVSGTLLAYDESENWMRRINEFNKCTGANLRIKYQEGGEAAMAQALINDVGVDIHSGNGIYDAYIVRAPWMPPIYRGLRPLSEKIKGSAEYVRFNDINEVTREAVSFDGEIYALPVDSHYIAMGWRQDVFELHADYYQNIYGEELAVPKTIEQLVLVSERLNGLDHNGDGEPDWGFCFTPTTNQFFTFLAPVLQTNMHECDKMLDGSGFDCSHGSNTGQNIFFDVDTFEPLIHNEGFRYVFDLYYRFIKSSNCQDSGDCDHTIDFPTGRCAGVLSLSDMMNTLLLDSIQPRYDNDGNVVWAPGQNLALGQHWGRRAIFPGSNKVVDWKAPGKPLIECTPEKCPLGKDGINYTPFFSQAGEAYAINGKVSKPRSADAMWDMFAWFAELPFADQPHQGLYRKSQLTDEYSVQLEENYNAVMAEDLRAVLEHYFRSQDEGNNPALDSRLRGFDEYDRKLGYELHDKLIFAEVAEGGLFSDDGPSLEAERNSQEYDERYNRFLSNVDAMFYEFNTKSEGGALGNLVLWRNHLNIHPVKSEVEICSELLARNPAVFDKLDCASAVDLEAMCPTQKDYVEAYAPGTCISSSSSDKTITTVIVLCSVLGGAVLVLIFYFGYHRYKKYIKLATEQKQLTETILNDSVRSTKSIDYPFHLIRGDEFVNENKLLRFEVLRNTHRLTVLDTLKDVDAFIDAGKQIVFLSHQWTSFAAPDPSGTQYEAMCLALKELARQSGWDESLKDVFIWVDYCCLPQANTSAQNLTIRSVAAYAASATYFIMVAPETMHADLDEVCDIDTYQERVWTRVEQVCHAMRNGTDGMFITKGKASPLEKVKREFFNESFRMFEGELTCCRLEHKGMALCDRQCLVVPLLGLYGELYRETVVGSKGGSGQCFECVDDFLTEIEKRQDEIFPPTFKRTTWRKNKQSEETIQLFGDLISRMKCRIKNGDGFTIDDDNTTSTMGSDYVRHGATHGIRF